MWHPIEIWYAYTLWRGTTYVQNKKSIDFMQSRSKVKELFFADFSLSIWSSNMKLGK